MTITITVFEKSPDRGKGLARDMRVRWAFEEVGQPYEVRLVSFGAMKEPAHRALHPFGQIPTYEEGDLVLFESGAIVLHIAQCHAGLLPDDANARARAITWMFAALSTVEPPILDLQTTRILEGDRPWYEQRLPLVQDRIRVRLSELSARLGDAQWLDGAFSAGDLMMVAVLLRLKPSGMLDEYPRLSAYVARGEERPAYKRAFDAQLAVFTGKQFFAAINRNDMQAITKDFDPQIERIEPEGFPTAGTYRGITEVQEHVTKGRGTWAEGTCDPGRFLVNGEKVVVYLQVSARLQGSTDWVGGRFADGFVFRSGKIIQYLSFGERAEALKWAGIEDSGAI
jgi:glutathione S-transferase